MKRLLLLISLCFLLPMLPASAQDDDALVQRILEANMPSTLQASWHQEKQSSLLTEVLVSDGAVYLQQPDRFRWEVRQPVQKLTVFDGETPRGRFRLPSVRDFTAQVMEDGQMYSVLLVPIRRDLKQFFRQISITVKKENLEIVSALLITPEGDWTRLSFSNFQRNIPLDEALFKKP